MRNERGDNGGKRLRGDGGAAAVEFALILPFLALLVCGVIDLGRWYSAWNETKNAAREGALYAQAHANQPSPDTIDPIDPSCADPTNIRYRVRQELAGSAANTFTVRVDNTTGAMPLLVNDCNTAAQKVPANGEVTVTVTRTVPLITPIIRNLVGPVDIKASVEATVQG